MATVVAVEVRDDSIPKVRRRLVDLEDYGPYYGTLFRMEMLGLEEVALHLIFLSQE